MARRRKKRATPRRTRTRTITKTRRVYVGKRRGARRRRRGGGGGILGGTVGRVLPSKSEMLDMAGAWAYGMLENSAKKDQTHFLNTMIADKTPIPSIGLAGNVALVARLLSVFVVRSPYLAHFANGVGAVAAYQLGRKGELFKEAKPVPFAIAGDDDDMMAGDLDMGALAADGQENNDYDGEGISGLDDEIVDNIEMLP